MTTMLEAYAAVTGADVTRYLQQLAELLKGKTVVHVNSTRVGGGVAEILDKLVLLSRELGIDTRWEVIIGGIRYPFNQKQKMQEIGINSREFVRENFLLPRQLREHLTLMVSLQYGAVDRIELS